LGRARGTSFENPDTSRVSIGTIVTVRDKNSQKQETFTILGAWDGDPDRHIISYQTAIGQALLGKKAGEAATLPNGEVEIVSIEPAPVDKPAPETANETATVTA
jgi:transcription elongation GreA/GreB family factor